MTEPSSAPPSAPQSLALNARAVAMLKAMGVTWRWPSPQVEPARAADPAPAQPPAETAQAQPGAPTQGPKQTPQAAPSKAEPASPVDVAPADRAAPMPLSEAGPAAPTAVIALKDVSWDQAQAQVLQCKACGMHEARLGAEWGQGERRARWLFVTAGLHSGDLGTGTVQGAEMDLLRSIWQAMGVPEVDVFVTSITKCRPALGRAAAPEEVSTCLAYLKHQHQWLQPDMVVALGLPVAHALWGASNQALSQWRGKIHQWQDSPAIVTYPLDALLRRPVDQTKTWADLCLALEHVAQATSE